jgi:hypothetical protein
MATCQFECVWFSLLNVCHSARALSKVDSQALTVMESDNDQTGYLKLLNVILGLSTIMMRWHQSTFVDFYLNLPLLI